MVITNQTGFNAFIAWIPIREITKTNPAPPSQDPLLKKPKVYFGTNMVLVAIRHDTMYISPKFESLTVNNDTLRVVVLDRGLGDWAGLAQCIGVGTYYAVIVPKHNGLIQFIRKKEEATQQSTEREK
jgi:hypothetical protein